MTPTTRAGFTLMEFLTVVAMVTILAAIAVPNFLEAQFRVKVAGTRQDLAVIAAGLRGYYADYQVFPPNQPAVRAWLVEVGNTDPLLSVGSLATPEHSPLTYGNDIQLGATPRPSDPQVRRGSALSNELETPPLLVSGDDLRVLTTPVAYIGNRVPTDSFERGAPFVYLDYAGAFGLGSTFAMAVASRGPDASILGGARTPRGDLARGRFTPYDPTNGVNSVGDVFVRW